MGITPPAGTAIAKPSNVLMETSPDVSIVAVGQSNHVPERSPFANSGQVTAAPSLSSILAALGKTTSASQKDQESASATAIPKGRASKGLSKIKRYPQTMKKDTIKENAKTGTHERIKPDIFTEIVEQFSQILEEHRPLMRVRRETGADKLGGLYTGANFEPFDFTQYLSIGQYDKEKAKKLCQSILIDPALANLTTKEKAKFAKELCKIIFSFAYHNALGVEQAASKAKKDAQNAYNSGRYQERNIQALEKAEENFEQAKANADEIRTLINKLLGINMAGGKETFSEIDTSAIWPEPLNPAKPIDFMRTLVSDSDRFQVFFATVGFGSLIVFIHATIAFVFSMSSIRKAMVRRKQEMAEVRKAAKMSTARHQSRLERRAAIAAEIAAQRAAAANEAIPLLVDVAAIELELPEPELEPESAAANLEPAVEEDDIAQFIAGILQSIEAKMNNPAATQEELDGNKKNKWQSELESKLTGLAQELYLDKEPELSSKELAKYSKPSNEAARVNNTTKQIGYKDFNVNETVPYVHYFTGVSHPSIQDVEAEKAEEAKQPRLDIAFDEASKLDMATGGEPLNTIDEMDDSATVTETPEEGKPQFDPLPADMGLRNKAKILAIQKNAIDKWVADCSDAKMNRKLARDKLAELHRLFIRKVEQSHLLVSVFTTQSVKAAQDDLEALHSLCLRSLKYNQLQLFKIEQASKQRFNTVVELSSFLDQVVDPELERSVKADPSALERWEFGELLYQMPEKEANLAAFVVKKQKEQQELQLFLDVYQEAIDGLVKEKASLHQDAMLLAQKHLSQAAAPVPSNTEELAKSIAQMQSFAQYPARLKQNRQLFTFAMQRLEKEIQDNIADAQNEQFAHSVFEAVSRNSLLTHQVRELGGAGANPVKLAENVTDNVLTALGLNGNEIPEHVFAALTEKAQELIENAIIAFAHESLYKTDEWLDYGSIVLCAVADFNGKKKELDGLAKEVAQLQMYQSNQDWGIVIDEEELEQKNAQLQALIKDRASVERNILAAILQGKLEQELEKRRQAFVPTVNDLVGKIKDLVAKAFAEHMMMHLRDKTSQIATQMVTAKIKEVLIASLTENRLEQLISQLKAQKTAQARADIRKKLKLPQGTRALAIKHAELTAKLRGQQTKPKPKFQAGKQAALINQAQLKLKIEAADKLVKSNSLRAKHKNVATEILPPLHRNVFESEQGLGVYHRMIKRRDDRLRNILANAGNANQEANPNQEFNEQGTGN